jgi:hypothetical protein
MLFSRGIRCALAGALVGVCVITSAAHASLNLSSSLGTTHAGNLVSNGSFELGNITPAPPDGVHSNLFVTPPDDWTPFGAPIVGAVWGNDGVIPYRLKASDVLADQRLGVFFGTGTGTTVSPAPTFQPNGRVVFPLPPTFNYAPGEGPVSLSQSVLNLNALQTYKISFWVSGEENSTNQGNTSPGIIEFNLTNVLAGDPSVYLAVPNGTLYGMSKLYEFTFQPLTSGQVDITFTGHGRMFYGGTQFGPGAILDDVIINAVPEPGALAAVGVSLLLLRRRRSRRARRAPGAWA